MSNFTELKGFKDVNTTWITERIRSNLIEFFDWGLLEKGNFFNVGLDQSGAFGTNLSRLRRVEDPRYNDGQVWEAFRSNWVWQSGVNFSPSPTRASGVWVDDTFYHKSTSGDFSHVINYPQGRIIFDSAVSTSSKVKTEYSYKWINVVDANTIPWFREVQFESQRRDNEHFLQVGSGDWSPLEETRVQLPTVAVQVPQRRTFEPYQLGLGQWSDTRVFFHILGEDSWSVGKIADIISMQNEKTIFMFDLDDMASKNRFPLTVNGDIAPSALVYPDLVQPKSKGGFRWRKMRLFDFTVEEEQQIHESLYRNTVRAIARVALTEI